MGLRAGQSACRLVTDKHDCHSTAQPHIGTETGGTGGHVPPNNLFRGDTIGNVPSNILSQN